MFEEPSEESSRQAEIRETQPRDPLVTAAEALVEGIGRILRRTPIRVVRLYRQRGFVRADKNRSIGAG